MNRMLSMGRFYELLGQAGAISPDLKGMVSDMYTQGKTEREIVHAILDAAGARPKAGTGRITHIDQVSDDTLFRSICDPVQLSFSHEGPQMAAGGVVDLPKARRMKDVTDDVLFEGIKNVALM